ncbi:MAG TPA: META domain-containing protein [Sphingomicrobium sp.]|nr:META domain-containing protein [Sphingomicrobium sp.]
MPGRLAAAALPLLAGCTSIHADQRSFEGSLWHVAAINGEATGPAHAYHMSFGQGRVSARFGCNYLNGRYSASGETMTVRQIASTKMACGGPPGSHERAGLAILAEPMRMTWAGNRLSLSNPHGSIALERRP